MTTSPSLALLKGAAAKTKGKIKDAAAAEEAAANAPLNDEIPDHGVKTDGEEDMGGIIEALPTDSAGLSALAGKIMKMDKTAIAHFVKSYPGLPLPEGFGKLAIKEQRSALKAATGCEQTAIAALETLTGSSSKETVKSVSGEIVQKDEFTDMVHEIETLNEKDAIQMVDDLKEAAEFSYFKLGGVLSVIQDNGWYKPYASFREMVEKKFELHYRKAAYWVSIYKGLVESKVPWSKVKHLGWSKLKELASIMTVENADQWVAIAEQQTVIQLIETITNSQLANNTKAIEDLGDTKVVSSMAFKVHEDQRLTIEAAIEKAKEITGSTVATVALEHICLDFMGGAKVETLEDRLIKVGVKAALEAISKAFPDVAIEAELP